MENLGATYFASCNEILPYFFMKQTSEKSKMDIELEERQTLKDQHDNGEAIAEADPFGAVDDFKPVGIRWKGNKILLEASENTCNWYYSVGNLEQAYLPSRHFKYCIEHHWIHCGITAATLDTNSIYVIKKLPPNL